MPSIYCSWPNAKGYGNVPPVSLISMPLIMLKNLSIFILTKIIALNYVSQNLSCSLKAQLIFSIYPCLVLQLIQINNSGCSLGYEFYIYYIDIIIYYIYLRTPINENSYLNKSINQPISKAINQSGQPLNQSILEQSINYSISQSINPSFNNTMHYSFN